jgi:hypothetical protein
VPGLTQGSPQAAKKKRYSLSVRPRSVRSGQMRSFRFRAKVADAAGKRPLARGIVVFAGRRVRTDARGVAVVRAALSGSGRRAARLMAPGAKRRAVAKAFVTVR